MGVNVGTVPVLAFLSILLAALLIIGAVVARRKGVLRSRGIFVGLAVIAALLVAFGMTGGFLPKM